MSYAMTFSERSIRGLVLAVCLSCCAFAAQGNGQTSLTRQALAEIRADARCGNKDSLVKLTARLERFEALSLDAVSLSVVEDFLADEDADIQLAGAAALYAAQNRSAKPALVSYLQKKDFRETEVPVGADHREIGKAVDAIQSIRDPEKVPELMATVYKATVAPQVRHAALSAIGHIKPSGIDDFLRSILTDPEMPENLQRSAAVVAGRSERVQLEPMLLTLAEDCGEHTAPYALAGLVLMKPDTYLKQWFANIMDPDLDVDYRARLAGIEFYFSRELLRQHKDEICACLTAVASDGRPVDVIRLHAWRLIYELFAEKPGLELSEVSKGTRSSLRGLLEKEIMLADPRMDIETRNRKLDEEIR